MTLRKEVVDRLLLAKSILLSSLGSSTERPNAHVVARQVLNSHDAADLVFAAIADHLGKVPPKNKDSMMQCLEAIRPFTADLHTGFFKQLNEARNSLKHAGNLPNTNQWATVARDVFERLSNLCQETLDVSWEQLDESALLTNEEVRAYLSSAKSAREVGDFKVALEEIGKALFVSLEAAVDNQGIEVGFPLAEDALKLTAFGVSAIDFLKLQEFVPVVDRFSTEPFNIYWRQKKFGHPGNWRDETVEFCSAACLNVALNIQNAAWTPHAYEFDVLYQYKITSLKDQVEVWEDLVEGNITEDQRGSRLFRAFKRHLARGESITMPANTPGLISEDFLPNGRDRIRRLRVSPENLLSMFPSEENPRAEFVNLSDVKIMCVPKAWAKEQFPGIPEIPYREDRGYEQFDPE